MEKEINNIIDNSDEPVYDLDAYITSLKTIDQQRLAWETLKEIGLTGDLKRRFVVLTVISVNQPWYLKSFAHQLITQNNFKEIEPILPPIITICSLYDEEDFISYMIDVFDFASASKQEYLLEITLRNILKTSSWKRIEDKVVAVIMKIDELTLVDLLAFFLYNRSSLEFEELINFLPAQKRKQIFGLEQKVNTKLGSYQMLK